MAKTNAQVLLDHGLEPVLPQQRLKNEILRRLRQAKENAVARGDALQSLFPHTLFDTATLELIVTGLLAGNHLLLFGPSGTGKTNVAKDILALFPRELWAVDGCPVQDDPFSVIDPHYAELVPMCPFCRARFGGSLDPGEIEHTSIDPKEVPVTRILLREGYGFARVQGSPEVFPDNLTGTINIHKLETVGDPTSPLILEPGKLLQANRGLILLDEVGKLPIGTQNVLLQALQESIVTPAKSRETFPASFIAITTSNLDDLDNINEPLNDRLTNIHIGYNNEFEKNHQIIEQYFDAHRRSIPLPRLYINSAINLLDNWRRNAAHISELSEVGSNRTMIDILLRAEAYALMEDRAHLLPSYFKLGAKNAMLGRVRARGGDSYLQNRNIILSFIDEHADEELARGAQQYWCRFFRDVLGSNERRARQVIDEGVQCIDDPSMLQRLPRKPSHLSHFYRFAQYVARTERFMADQRFERRAATVFALLRQLDIFRCPDTDGAPIDRDALEAEVEAQFEK